MIPEVPIISFEHPLYADNLHNWVKWRRTYESGDQFIHQYLKRFSRRESNEDFKLRKSITYCPSFAKAAINEVKNSIFQRTIDVTRIGGPKTYQDAIAGRDGGIDRAGNSMNSFVGRRILPELLTMARVGIFVDMPQLPGPTIADKGTQRPYLYFYRTEQIKSWTYDIQRPDRLLSVLLEDFGYLTDEVTGLTTGLVTHYRHLWINNDGYCMLRYYGNKGETISEDVVLTITEIPLIILELSGSLLDDVANYQIALLNLESSDLFYALRSNFPFYTEQFDPKSESLYLKSPGNDVEIINTDRKSDISTVNNSPEIVVGTATGRRYPVGSERPAFINPSAEPLKISMEKADQIKKDIRLLINLAIANLEPSKRSSAESKNVDEKSLESGLSYIGLELEVAERKIAQLWSTYEGSRDIATINYPENYSLKSDEERRVESKNLQELLPKIPSKTFQKEATKRIVDLTIGHNISYTTLIIINNEIDQADVVIADPDTIDLDIKNGLVSNELASKIRGYPEGQVKIAEIEHADRLARIAISQSKGMGAARGVNDLENNPKSADQEKQLARDKTYDAEPKEKVRGEG